MSDSNFNSDSDSDSENPWIWDFHVDIMKRIGIDAWTGEEIPGFSNYYSEEELEELSEEEMQEILEVKSQESQYMHTDSVLNAL